MPEICAVAEYQAYLGLDETITESDHGLLTVLHLMVERAVRKHVGYAVAQATYTHYLPATDTLPDRDQFVELVGNKVILSGTRSENNSMWTPEVPIRSITTLHEDVSARAGSNTDGAWASDTLLTEGTDFYIDWQASGLSRTGELIRVGSGWPAEARTVQLVYVAGYTAAELADEYSHFKLACLLMMAKYFNESKAQQPTSGGGSGPVISRKLGPAAWTYATAGSERNKSLAIDVPFAVREILEDEVRYSSLVA